MRCFSCGAEINYVGICPSCKTSKDVRKIREYHVQENLPAHFDELVRIQHQFFSELSEKLEDIASILEWGFHEIVWQLSQQTEILRSIDQTLKTPSETQANEWRKMGEELRRRGVLDEAEDFFLKARKSNPLDYRIYMGLAETYILRENLDDAKIVLEQSLLHALSKGTFDFKSYSYRLIGRIYFCHEEYQDAATTLKNAIGLSPDYADGLYDYSQYSALIKNREDSLLALEKAINKKTIYFYFAQKEKNFYPIRNYVDHLLNKIREEARQNAQKAITAAKNELGETLKAGKVYNAHVGRQHF